MLHKQASTMAVSAAYHLYNGRREAEQNCGKTTRRCLKAAHRCLEAAHRWPALDKGKDFEITQVRKLASLSF
jgi:hypothetical protein